MRPSDKTKAALRRGETMLGHFAPAGTDYEVAGALRWSAEDGAQLELADHAPAWPLDVGGADYTVHGRLLDDGALTLLGAWTKRVSMARTALVVRSPTLAIGEFTDHDALWTRAIYATANQAEWRSDTGLHYKRPELDADGERPTSPSQTVLRVEVRQPTRDGVVLPAADIAFEGNSSGVLERGPDWSISTQQVLVVNPRTAATARDLHRRYAQPLVALTSFAADHPDAIVHEVLLDLAEGRRVEIWRMGSRSPTREWRDGDRFLFTADALTDYSAAIRAWWTLYDEVWPALGVFADHIAEDNTYSPTRLITLYSAIEAYGAVRHKTKEFRRLRDYAGVSTDVTGCTNAALDLLGASRGYFAHLVEPGQKYTREIIQDNLLLSIRRGHALMQACVLRDLGLDAAQTEELLRRHQTGWPLK